MFDEHRMPHMLAEQLLIEGLNKKFNKSSESQDWLNERQKKVQAYEKELDR